MCSSEDGVNSAVRHLDNSVFNELLNNKASVILSVLNVLYVPLKMV
jgi:hypothetical protein